MADYSPFDDLELMHRIRSQDQTALTTLYERYGGQVYSLAYRILQNAHLAEEVTQDTFMKVWQQSSRWDSTKGKLSSWILTVTRYTAIDLLRSEQRQSMFNSVSIDGIPLPASATGTPEDTALLNNRLLHDLMTQLPKEQAHLIELAFFQGLTHRELSEKLTLPLGTVKTRVRLGLQKLKTLWGDAIGTKEAP